jgi:CDP-diacylglycerol--glycerol-3-phosphate 3-phosphatidyltransferase
VALRARYPAYIERFASPFGRLVARLGVSPNQLTSLGLLLTAASAVAVANGQFVAGGWLLVAGGAMDLLDGSVARATGRSTPFGSFYDSVSDRIADAMIFSGLALALHTQPRLLALILVALVASFVTSYVRAKAEAIDLACTVGLLERGERAVLLMLALLLHQYVLEAALWVLAVGGVVTIIQRVHHVWCQIDRDIPVELIALTMHDRAWSRAFKVAARRFYGEHNFDGAYDAQQKADDAGVSP